MFEKLGKRALILPLVFPFVMFIVFGLAVGPTLSANMKEVPFAVVTLDEGSSLPVSDVNVGDTLVEKLLDGESLGSLGSDDEDADDSSNSAFGDTTIQWTVFDTEEELREALANNEYYGGIIIPADFTSQQMMSSTGLGGAPTITVLLNEAKNPSLAQQMGPTMRSAMLKAGISVDVEEVNDADLGGGSMAANMGVQMIAMPMMIMTLIVSILISLVYWPREGEPTRKQRLLALVKQIIIGALASALVAGLCLGIEVGIGGMTLPVDRLFPFLWLACGCMMAAVVGLADFALPLGALVGVTTVFLGMCCAMLAGEMLPEFWQTWVYPWAPQHYIGDAIRAIEYLGKGSFDTTMWYWGYLPAIGGVGALLALAMPTHKKKRGAHGKAAASIPAVATEQ